MTPTTDRVFQIFKELNQIPRPSHHEERVADSFHFRPSANERRVYYTAKLNNCDLVDGWTQAELRDAIIASGKNGIEGELEE